MKIEFLIKPVSIHPAFGNQGNEYVCVEFGYRPVQIPTMVPTDVPREVSDMIEASKHMVKVFVPPQFQAKMRTYANRLFLFLTLHEWESLEQKYTVGDEFKITVESNGNIKVSRQT